MKAIYLLTAVAVLCAPVTVLAAVAWTNPAGTSTSFTWANGQNDTNNFGSPSDVGDAFVFFTNFDASASNGDTNVSQGDTMDVDLAVLNVGDEFDKISVTMYGDYSITNPNDPANDNSVEADFDMSSDQPGAGLTDNLNFFENNAGSGSWSEIAEIDFDTGAYDVTSLHLTIDGDTTSGRGVIAISDGNGGTASITASTTYLQIALTVIPEPASLALLALGGLAFLRRRR